MTNETYAVVLNWRNAEDTIRCLRSILSQSSPPTRVLCVDNGSGDGSAERISNACGAVDLVCLDSNLGFAAGNNRGISRAINAGAQFVWLLNNDAVAAPDCLENMVRAAETQPDVAAVGSVILDYEAPNRLQEWGGGRFDPLLGRCLAHRKPVPPARLGYITGASLLLRVEALRALGLLDESFFLYGEDVELGQRLRRAGWRLDVAHQALVWHKRGVSTSSERKEYYLNMAAVRLQKAYAPVAPLMAVCGTVSRVLRFAARNDWRRAAAAASGAWAGWQAKDVGSGVPAAPQPASGPCASAPSVAETP